MQKQVPTPTSSKTVCNVGKEFSQEKPDAVIIYMQFRIFSCSGSENYGSCFGLPPKQSFKDRQYFLSQAGVWRYWLPIWFSLCYFPRWRPLNRLCIPVENNNSWLNSALTEGSELILKRKVSGIYLHTEARDFNHFDCNTLCTSP